MSNPTSPLLDNLNSAMDRVQNNLNFQKLLHPNHPNKLDTKHLSEVTNRLFKLYQQALEMMEHG